MLYDFMTHFMSCVSVEEERRVRANDREYNEKFQYAVSESPVFCCTSSKIWTLSERTIKHFNLWNN